MTNPNDDALEALTRGYIEAALWADCMPQSLGEILRAEGWPSVADDADDGIEPHVLANRLREIQEYEIAGLIESYSDETGNRRHLSMREDGAAKMRADCAAFLEANLNDLRAYCVEIPTRLARYGHGMEDVPMAYAGHDLWLTRGGHGAGFWDRDLGELGERLSEAARAMGEPEAPYDCGDGTADV